MPLNRFHTPLFKCYKQLVICLLMILTLNSCMCKAQTSGGPWSNPLLIHGSSFGSVFQQLYLTHNYELMLQLTATDSRKILGDSVILGYYEQMQFAYPIRLISHTQRGNTYQLLYKTIINGTVVRLKVDIMVENDTSRVVWPLNLNETKYYPFGHF